VLNVSAVVSFYGLAETRKMLAEYDDKELANKMRRAARAGIGEFRTELRAEASAGEYPHSFRKTKTRTTTRGGASGREIEAYVRPSSPLFNIFEPGAGEHTIAPKNASALAGPAGGGSWTNEGRKRPAPFFARGPVRHPGMKARPLLARTFNARVARAEDAVANAIFGHPVGAAAGKP
jgi:hypothetical protein